MSTTDESQNLLGENTRTAPEFEVYSDASVNASERIIGVGWVICRDDTVLCRGSKAKESDITTQEAEAFAVKCAVEQLKAMDWFESDITVYTDNEGVAIGFERETRLHQSELYCKVLEYLSADEVEQINRSENEIAHQLSQEARENVEENKEFCPRCGTTDPSNITCRCESRDWYKCSACNRSFFDR